MDWNGGTYCSQVQATSYLEAPQIWATEIDFKKIPGLGAASKNNLIAQSKDIENAPIQLAGLESIWCITFSLRGKLALVNFIRTEHMLL